MVHGVGSAFGRPRPFSPWRRAPGRTRDDRRRLRARAMSRKPRSLAATAPGTLSPSAASQAREPRYQGVAGPARDLAIAVAAQQSAGVQEVERRGIGDEPASSVEPERNSVTMASVSAAAAVAKKGARSLMRRR